MSAEKLFASGGRLWLLAGKELVIIPFIVICEDQTDMYINITSYINTWWYYQKSKRKSYSHLGCRNLGGGGAWFIRDDLMTAVGKAGMRKDNLGRLTVLRREQMPLVWITGSGFSCPALGSNTVAAWRAAFYAPGAFPTLSYSELKVALGENMLVHRLGKRSLDRASPWPKMTPPVRAGRSVPAPA